MALAAALAGLCFPFLPFYKEVAEEEKKKSERKKEKKAEKKDEEAGALIPRADRCAPHTMIQVTFVCPMASEVEERRRRRWRKQRFWRIGDR